MRYTAQLLAFASLLLLSGCGYWFNGFNSTVAAEKLVSVDQLTTDPAYQPQGSMAKAIEKSTGTTALTQYYLGEAAIDSEDKCTGFLKRLTVGANTSGAVLDTTSVTAGALGAVFVPLETVHILSATAAIATGTHQAISNNLYGKATIANYAQAIKATYFVDMNNYMTYLETATAAGTSLNLSVEMARINTFHSECSLAAAQSWIDTTLQNAESSAAVKTNATTIAIAVTGVKKGDSFTISSGKLIEAYQAMANESAASIADGLANDINTKSDFVAANVSALAGKGNLVITAPASADLNWNLKPPASGATMTIVAPTPSGS